jgi:hypothetical protein
MKVITFILVSLSLLFSSVRVTEAACTHCSHPGGGTFSIPNCQTLAARKAYLCPPNRWQYGVNPTTNKPNPLPDGTSCDTAPENPPEECVVQPIALPGGGTNTATGSTAGCNYINVSCPNNDGSSGYCTSCKYKIQRCDQYGGTCTPV